MIRYKFKLEPYAHQMTALELSANKREYALFLEMGTGKSKIIIDTIAMLYDSGEIQGALIIAPKGVYKNWEQSELPTHLPDHIDHKIIMWSPETTRKRLEHLDQAFHRDESLKIVVMNVEAFSSEKGVTFAQKFLKYRSVLMAVDESTTIKNRTAKRTKSIVKLGELAQYKRIATGSPVTQSPLDLYSQCEFLDPWALGYNSFWAFQSRYAKMHRRSVGSHSFNQIVGYQHLEELSERLETFSYRVRKEDCLDLPEKVYTKRLVELTDEQRRIYTQMKNLALAELEGALTTAPNVLTQILRLQQVCSGFVKMDDGTINNFPSNKMSELLAAIEEVDGKVIIWATFTQDLLNIEKELKSVYGEDSVRTYYGQTEVEQRQQTVRDFQDPTNPLRFFVGQPRTGGYGLTLTAAKTVIYYSNNYDLEIRLQSEDRAHRIGQRNTVTYIDLVTEKTVEEKILQALRSKINLATQVLNEDYKQWII